MSDFLKKKKKKKKKNWSFLKLVVMKTIQHKACTRRQTPISLKCSIDVVLSSFTVHWLGFSNLRNSADLLSLSLTSTCTFQVMYTFDSQSLLNIGIKHGFSCINIRQVLREVLKTEAGGRDFKHLLRDLVNVDALKKHVRSLLLHKNWKFFLHFALFLVLFCFAFSPMSRERNFHRLCSF